jgi:hypothetical protein
MILPFMEYKTIHDMGKTGGSVLTPASQTKKDANAMMCGLPIDVHNCPTRRKGNAYPVTAYSDSGQVNMSPCTVYAHSDYAGNGGDGGDYYDVGPAAYSAIATWPWGPSSIWTGVIYQRSVVKEREVSDGLSRTLLFGEKYLNPDYYYNSSDVGDNGPLVQGYDWDIIRLGNSNRPPYRDRRGNMGNWSFGSAHPQGFNAVFCDASVHTINYDIETIDDTSGISVYRRLTNRADNLSVDSSKVGL